MNVAIIGCGYVAEHYAASLRRFPHLRLLGVYDLDKRRSQKLAEHAAVLCYSSMDEVLENSDVDIVVNLTNPTAHRDVIRQSLKAGKHVYTEKPITMRLKHSQKLAECAAKHNVRLASAPCTLLSATAQTLWSHIQRGAIGRPRLILAELSDGYISQHRMRRWFNRLQIPWPYRDEFQVGCTLEHSAYYLSWLAAIFGPAIRVNAFSAALDETKQIEFGIRDATPDFAAGCISFPDGVVARFTTSTIAPFDHSLMIVGDEGVLTVKDCWNNRAPVRLQKRISLRRKTMLTRARSLPFAIKQKKATRRGPLHIDFAAGISELAESISEQRVCRLGAEFSLHVNELCLALHNGEADYQVKTNFAPIAPLFKETP